MQSKNILVTGGAGFIGSCFTLMALEQGHRVIVLDLLTYAGDQANLRDAENNAHYTFVQGDINDQALITELLQKHNINWVVNFAAESHVDNSIKSPENFIRTNVLGTYSMLWSSLQYWQDKNKPTDFRFLHISTDEVYGSLEKEEPAFNENNPYKPNSPYSASKAGGDHLVRAWYETYGLPTLTTNCSNNYGPRQHKEKLIPTLVDSCLNKKALPIYGDGKNIRDWIYVEDHCRGIFLALEKGHLGETYCFGGNAERENIFIAHEICRILDELKPRDDAQSYQQQITFVADRLGHDRRYAIDNTKAYQQLGFVPENDFEHSLKQTIIWYLNGCA